MNTITLDQIKETIYVCYKNLNTGYVYFNPCPATYFGKVKHVGQVDRWGNRAMMRGTALEAHEWVNKNAKKVKPFPW